MAVTVTLWAIEWRSKNTLDGAVRRLHVWHRYKGIEYPTLFRTRRACRAFIDETYGYIRRRPDLKAEPHGWRVPQAVKVTMRVSKRHQR